MMEMTCEKFKNVLAAVKTLKKLFGRNLTDVELDELINTSFESFCNKRNINSAKVEIIEQMRDFINKYAEMPNILPDYYFSQNCIDFIADVAKKYVSDVNWGLTAPVKNHVESLEEDINNIDGFAAESSEDEFKIALKMLLDKYKIFTNNTCKCDKPLCGEVKKENEDDIDVLIDRLKDGEELELSEELQDQILERLYKISNNFNIKIINGKMSLHEC